MKKILAPLIAVMCLLLSSCGSQKLTINTPETVYATYYSGPDVHDWSLSQDEISSWTAWMNGLSISPINLEESKALIDYMYYNGSHPQYSFDAGTDGSLEQIAYFDVGLEYGFLHMDGTWYRVDNPTEPFGRY